MKMVHNGIEYADMQLIAEAYLLLKYAGGFNNQELAEEFSKWNKGELKSFLIGITAGIFGEADDFSEGQLVDYIVDSAGQKGTGRWTSLESLKQGVNVSMITAACNARIMSNRLEQRAEAKKVSRVPKLRRRSRKQTPARRHLQIWSGKGFMRPRSWPMHRDLICSFMPPRNTDGIWISEGSRLYSVPAVLSRQSF